MKIPSTKRICLVGHPHQSPHQHRTSKVLHYVATQMANFKPREKVEKVRNCTKIGSDIIDIIVKSVFKVCLQSDNMIKREDGSSWNAGNEVPLTDVVAHLQVIKSLGVIFLSITKRDLNPISYHLLLHAVHFWLMNNVRE